MPLIILLARASIASWFVLMQILDKKRIQRNNQTSSLFIYVNKIDKIKWNIVKCYVKLQIRGYSYLNSFASITKWINK